MSVQKKSLAEGDLVILFAAAQKRMVANGANFYGWKNRPTYGNRRWHNGDTEIKGRLTDRVMSPEAASVQVKAKLDGAYGERFLLSLPTIAGLIRNGYRVRLVQFQKEVGVPFDANGWLCVVVETMPLFHIPPWDLDAVGLVEIVEILADNTAPDVSWKQTNKIGEFTAILQGTLYEGLDLLAIAQEASR